MLFLLSLVIRASARLLAGKRRDDSSKDLEILEKHVNVPTWGCDLRLWKVTS